MSLLCRFGLHRWGVWMHAQAQRELMPGHWQRGERRRCRRCGVADFRWTS